MKTLADDAFKVAVAGDAAAAELATPPPAPQGHAPGSPGIAPTWSSSDKDFVTAALGGSRLWITGGHGVLNEIYWPSTGRPRTRDMTFYLVHESGDGRWLDLKRLGNYALSTPDPCIPLPQVRHEGDLDGEPYALDLEFLPDTDRDCLLITWSVEGPWRLAVVLAPHVDANGRSSRAWVGDGALFAEDEDGVPALCLVSRDGFALASAGYVGASDGWQDLGRNGSLIWSYAEAGPGNVALTGLCRGSSGQIALAISETAIGARTLARSTLADDTAAVRRGFASAWEDWSGTLGLPQPCTGDADLDTQLAEAALVSAAVLKTHEDRGFPGASVASLSVPWGSFTDTLGGYHLVWPRDTVLTAFAHLAIGQCDEGRRTLAHLIAVQNPDGSWPQNCYPSGEPFWTGIQLDEAALPVLLAAKLRELGEEELDGTAAAVRRAVSFIARTGPSTPQDRWEENAGINPFTLACMIAALVAAAPWLDDAQGAEALDIADEWLERLDEWCWVTASRWTHEVDVPGHWIRLRPPPGSAAGTDTVQLRNRGGETIPAADLVAMEFSYLSRLGLVAGDDPRVRASVAVADRALATATPSGTVFHRYNEDGYGEQADGSPFDGSGIGRGWPFLSGERGHLALDMGEDALPHLKTMLACRSVGGLMPEQVWDAQAILDRGLLPGRPSGSAMPLLWTHSEFIKLVAAHATGRPVERLRAVEQRYASARPARCWRWRDEAPVRVLPANRALAVEAIEPFTLHAGLDDWSEPRDIAARPTPFGTWGASLSAADLYHRKRVLFTRRFQGSGGERWEGRDHTVRIGGKR